MNNLHNLRFPGESAAYRAARNALLEAEMQLRKQIEQLAEFRRKLPLGGKLKQDYLFDEGAPKLNDHSVRKQIRFSDLFENGKNSLIIYSFMYAPDDELPCPMCTSLLDSLNGAAPHVQQQANFAVVAKAPIDKIRSWARERNWHQLRLLSSLNNSYNRDYHAENSEQQQMPSINVFHKTADGIFHFYNSELFYAPMEPNQHPRHADMFWPLWNLLDLTPEGRGNGWLPQHHYD